MTEIEKNLKKMADEIPVPEKLSPDQIEKKLKNKQPEKDNIKKKKKKKKINQ